MHETVCGLCGDPLHQGMPIKIPLAQIFFSFVPRNNTFSCRDHAAIGVTPLDLYQYNHRVIFPFVIHSPFPVMH